MHRLTQDDIKKAYRLLALKVHPDKSSHLPAEEQAKSTERFQTLSKYYAILSDPKKRARYDATGSLEDAEAWSFSDMKEDGVTWDDYFKAMFDGIVSEETIQEYSDKYRCR
jgi:DnaJ family protein C protein 9